MRAESETTSISRRILARMAEDARDATTSDAPAEAPAGATLPSGDSSTAAFIFLRSASALAA
jgi:hypothetical protein